MSLKKGVSIMIGKCLPSSKPVATKIVVSQMELDENLLMYFKKLSIVYAHDPEKLCKTGDVVLIEELPEKLSKLVTHKVRKVVYPLGDVVDPITNKRVVAEGYREDEVERNKIYGRNRKAFNYEKAPPRGWQEGKKDFSDKPTYKKFHEYPDKDQPYGV